MSEKGTEIVTEKGLILKVQYGKINDVIPTSSIVFQFKGYKHEVEKLEKAILETVNKLL